MAAFGRLDILVNNAGVAVTKLALDTPRGSGTLRGGDRQGHVPVLQYGVD